MHGRGVALFDEPFSDPATAGWPTRLVCMSCTKIRPPRACTAAVTCLQPATWPGDQILGMRA
jgi:hypothetical protein